MVSLYSDTLKQLVKATELKRWIRIDHELKKKTRKVRPCYLRLEVPDLTSILNQLRLLIQVSRKLMAERCKKPQDQRISPFQIKIKNMLECFIVVFVQNYHSYYYYH